MDAHPGLPALVNRRQEETAMMRKNASIRRIDPAPGLGGPRSRARRGGDAGRGLGARVKAMGAGVALAGLAAEFVAAAGVAAGAGAGDGMVCASYFPPGSWTEMSVSLAGTRPLSRWMRTNTNSPLTPSTSSVIPTASDIF